MPSCLQDALQHLSPDLQSCLQSLLALQGCLETASLEVAEVPATGWFTLGTWNAGAAAHGIMPIESPAVAQQLPSQQVPSAQQFSSQHEASEQQDPSQQQPQQPRIAQSGQGQTSHGQHSQGQLLAEAQAVPLVKAALLEAATKLKTVNNIENIF